MKKKLICTLLAAASALSLAACTKKVPSSPDQRPVQTLPSIQTQVSPQVQLSQAIGLSAGTGAFVLRYGTVWQDTETQSEQQLLHTDSGYISLLTTPTFQTYIDGSTLYTLSGETLHRDHASRPYDSATVFADVYSLLPNPNLIRDFCAERLTVTPKQDGSLDYVSGLSLEEVYSLIHGQAAPGGLLPDTYAEAACTATFHLDALGRFTGLTIDTDLYQSGSEPAATHRLFVRMERIGELETIAPPAWISETT